MPTFTETDLMCVLQAANYDSLDKISFFFGPLLTSCVDFMESLLTLKCLQNICRHYMFQFQALLRLR